MVFCLFEAPNHQMYILSTFSSNLDFIYILSAHAFKLCLHSEFILYWMLPRACLPSSQRSTWPSKKHLLLTNTLPKHHKLAFVSHLYSRLCPNTTDSRKYSTALSGKLSGKNNSRYILIEVIISSSYRALLEYGPILFQFG